MKKVLSLVAIAAMTAFVVSCGNDEAAQKTADSLKADSTMKAHVKDSTDQAAMMKHKQDSMDAIVMETKRKADSAHMADSMANSKGNKAPKPKTAAQVTHAQNTQATGGRGH